MTWAAKYGYKEVVEMLIDIGTDVNIQDKVSCYM